MITTIKRISHLPNRLLRDHHAQVQLQTPDHLYPNLPSPAPHLALDSMMMRSSYTSLDLAGIGSGSKLNEVHKHVGSDEVDEELTPGRTRPADKGKGKARLSSEVNLI
jgi:hypothetical protein